MDTSYQKRLASRILKCGISRVRVEPAKEVGEALTREDVRGLIQKGLIWKVQKRGASRSHSRFVMSQKARGRRIGRGSRKGTKKSRNPPKDNWMSTIRAMRRLLEGLKVSGRIDNKAYRELYMKAKGGFFRNRQHMLLYMRDTGLLKDNEKSR